MKKYRTDRQRRLYLVRIRTPDRHQTYFFKKSGQNSDNGQTDNGQPFFKKSRQRTGLRQRNPDRQAPDSVFSKNPDRIRKADKIETDRIRTDRHRTANPDRIRTADRHRTRFSGKSGQKRDKDRTRTVLSADVCLRFQNFMSLTWSQDRLALVRGSLFPYSCI